MDYHKPQEDSLIYEGVCFLHTDIYSVVDSFYRKIAEHSSLKQPFASVHDWPEHIDRLTQFWWIRLGGKPYMFSQYNPVMKHYYAGFNESFLKEWLELFYEVLDEKLSREQAAAWKDLSGRMGQALLFKNNSLLQQRGSMD